MNLTTLRVECNAFYYRVVRSDDNGRIKKLIIEKQGWHWPSLLRPLLESCCKTVQCIEFVEANNIPEFFMLNLKFEQLQSIRWIPQEIITSYVPRSDLELDWFYYPRLLHVQGLDISPFLQPAPWRKGLTESSNPSLLALFCVNEMKLRAATTLCLCFRKRFGSKPLAKMVAQYVLQLDSSLWYVALPNAEKFSNPHLLPFSDPAYTAAVDKKVQKYNSINEKIQCKIRNIAGKKHDIERLEQLIVKRKRELESFQKTLEKHETSLKKVKGELNEIQEAHKVFKK